MSTNNPKGHSDTNQRGYQPNGNGTFGYQPNGNGSKPNPPKSDSKIKPPTNKA